VKYSLSDKQLQLLKQVAAAPKAFEVQGAHSGVLWALQQRTLVKTSYGAKGRQTWLPANRDPSGVRRYVTVRPDRARTTRPSRRSVATVQSRSKRARA